MEKHENNFGICGNIRDRKKVVGNTTSGHSEENAFAHDVTNPFNWPKKRKWMVVATVSCMMLLK
jgi:hypothetical protein